MAKATPQEIQKLVRFARDGTIPRVIIKELLERFTERTFRDLGELRAFAIETARQSLLEANERGKVPLDSVIFFGEITNDPQVREWVRGLAEKRFTRVGPGSVVDQFRIVRTLARGEYVDLARTLAERMKPNKDALMPDWRLKAIQATAEQPSLWTLNPRRASERLLTYSRNTEHHDPSAKRKENPQSIVDPYLRTKLLFQRAQRSGTLESWRRVVESANSIPSPGPRSEYLTALACVMGEEIQNS